MTQVSAFPNDGSFANGHPEGGLTKRELIAAMVMQGLYANDSVYMHSVCADIAVKAADALLYRLAAGGEGEG